MYRSIEQVRATDISKRLPTLPHRPLRTNTSALNVPSPFPAPKINVPSPLSCTSQSIFITCMQYNPKIRTTLFYFDLFSDHSASTGSCQEAANHEEPSTPLLDRSSDENRRISHRDVLHRRSYQRPLCTQDSILPALFAARFEGILSRVVL